MEALQLQPQSIQQIKAEVTAIFPGPLSLCVVSQALVEYLCKGNNRLRATERSYRWPADDHTITPVGIAFRHSSIMVVARVTRARPSKKSLLDHVQYDVGGTKLQATLLGVTHSTTFQLVHCFDLSASNFDVNAILTPLYQHLLSVQGSHACILADGPSGAGKSHTIFKRDDSIIMHALKYFLTQSTAYPSVVAYIFSAREFTAQYKNGRKFEPRAITDLKTMECTMTALGAFQKTARTMQNHQSS
ncbi:hypothetical protein P154DRAFT_358211 [Amniculicola lignicola CBS 123094]|uniref:Kinesin motor domain-containing protein n=1 Tax=Amniculicola lignicola CBS 123094 TaxID=1392246 RepID=A0A6A5WUT1_9PLEO|nr:hypothetical protein P154DRAFT_358211 [Amniculicola lignicola CBS 123094]